MKQKVRYALALWQAKTIFSYLNTDLEWKEVNQDISSLSIGDVSGKATLTISELINANEIVVHGSFGNNFSFIYPKGFLGAIEKTFNYSPIDTIYAKEGFLLINNETGFVKLEVSSSGSSNFAAEIFNIWYR